MQKKLTKFQQELAKAIHTASEKIGHGGLVPSDLAFALCKKVFNPHLDPLRILEGIETYDPTVLRNLKNGFYFTQRSPTSKEANPLSPEPDIVTEAQLTSTVEQYKGKLPCGIRAPNILVPIVKIKKVTRSEVNTSMSQTRNQHLMRRIEILKLLLQAQNDAGFIDTATAKAVCHQIEPGSDYEVILARMVSRNWLEENKSCWWVTPAGRSTIKSHNQS